MTDPGQTHYVGDECELELEHARAEITRLNAAIAEQAVRVVEELSEELVAKQRIINTVVLDNAHLRLRLGQELKARAKPTTPHDHVRIHGCYRCVWPDDQPAAAPEPSPEVAG